MIARLIFLFSSVIFITNTFAVDKKNLSEFAGFQLGDTLEASFDKILKKGNRILTEDGYLTSEGLVKLEETYYTAASKAYQTENNCVVSKNSFEKEILSTIVCMSNKGVAFKGTPIKMPKLLHLSSSDKKMIKKNPSRYGNYGISIIFDPKHSKSNLVGKALLGKFEEPHKDSNIKCPQGLASLIFKKDPNRICKFAMWADVDNDNTIGAVYFGGKLANSKLMTLDIYNMKKLSDAKKLQKKEKTSATKSKNEKIAEELGF